MKPKSIPQRILEALTKNGQADTDNLAQHLGVKGSSISSACTRLCKAGKIVRADGKQGVGSTAIWALPPAS